MAQKDEDKARVENEEFQNFAELLQPEMKQLIKLGDFQGTTGTKVKLTTNFVRCNLDVMNSKTDYIYQYRVDFDPICDNVEMKKAMVAYVLEDTGITHMFEGTMIFTFKKLSQTEDSLRYEVIENVYSVKIGLFIDFESIFRFKRFIEPSSSRMSSKERF